MAKAPQKATKAKTNSENKDEVAKTVTEEVSSEAGEQNDHPSKENPKNRLGLPALGLGLFLSGASVAALFGPQVFPQYFSAGDNEAVSQITASLKQTNERISVLESRPVSDPTSAISEAISNYKREVDAQLSELRDEFSNGGGAGSTEAVASLDQKITQVEETFETLREELLAASAEDGTIAADAVQAEIKTLRAELANVMQMNAELRAEISALNSSIPKQISDATASLATNGGLNAEAVTAADQDRALAELELAIRAGLPFEDQLLVAQATGILTPAELEDAKSGIKTQSELIQNFDQLVHEALRASAESEQNESLSARMQSFLQSQISIRSLEPQEGDSTDAILSRMNASLEHNDLGTVLQQAGSLDEAAASVLSNWLTDVEKRQATLAALARIKG